jgi:hypothetical protein
MTIGLPGQDPPTQECRLADRPSHLRSIPSPGAKDGQYMKKPDAKDLDNASGNCAGSVRPGAVAPHQNLYKRVDRDVPSWALTVLLLVATVVTQRYSQVVAVVLGVLTLLALFLVAKARRAGNRERIDALQIRFDQIPKEFSVLLRFEDGRLARATTTLGPDDYQTERAFESACGAAVKTIKHIRRIRRSLPGVTWQHSDNVTTWISVLRSLPGVTWQHSDDVTACISVLQRGPSLAEALYEDAAPEEVSFLRNVRAASIEACGRIKDRLSWTDSAQRSGENA